MSMRMPTESALAVWAPYVPSDEAPWNLERVVHLHRRAGFGATRAELERDLHDGPELALERLLNGKAQSAPLEGFDALSRTIGDAATASGNGDRLKAWWIYRMLVSPDPVGERLTLVWHNHFATSNRKVQDLVWMREQNETLRQHARGKFADLLAAVIKQPAMLAWLDADSNRKGHANENLARELLELFTLGIGNYSESDVQEAARALTGWTISDNRFVVQDLRHDEGEKRILGQSGPWTGDDLLRIVVEHPATSRRLSWRLCGSFFGEEVLGEAELEAFATGLREHELDLGWGVETLLRSQRFFSAANLRTRVASPVDVIIGTVVAVDERTTLPSTLLLAEAMSRMGQDLFYPPNVGGWREGRSWLSSRAIVARANFGASLLNGELWNPTHTSVVESLLARHGVSNELEPATVWLAELLWGSAPSATVSEVVAAASNAVAEQQITTAAILLLARPESQLT